LETASLFAQLTPAAALLMCVAAAALRGSQPRHYSVKPLLLLLLTFLTAVALRCSRHRFKAAENFISS
jgi:hypothetical protein